MMILKRMSNPRDDEWRGWWVFKTGLVDLMLTHKVDPYPAWHATLYINTPYFLRFSFELRYRE